MEQKEDKYIVLTAEKYVCLSYIKGTVVLILKKE